MLQERAAAGMIPVSVTGKQAPSFCQV